MNVLCPTLLLIVALSTLSAPAWGDTVVVLGPPNHTLVIQLEDELLATGETILTPPQKADATFEVNAQSKKLIIRAVHGANSAQKTIAFKNTSPTEVLVTATRALEELRILRAQLVPRSPDIVTAPVPHAPPPTETKAGIGFGLGVSLLGSRGTSPSRIYITPTLWAKLQSRLKLVWRIDFPTKEFTTQQPTGDATLKIYQSTLALEFNPLSLRSNIGLPIGLVAGTSWSRFSGTAAPPNIGHHGRLFSAMFGGRLTLVARVSSTVRLRFGGTAGIYLPEQKIVIMERVVMRFGRPFLQGLISLEVALP